MKYILMFLALTAQGVILDLSIQNKTILDELHLNESQVNKELGIYSQNNTAIQTLNSHVQNSTGNNSIAHTVTKESSGLPIIIFGGMGQKCDDQSIQGLTKQLYEKVNSAFILCYPTETLKAIQGQADQACSFMMNNDHYKNHTEINVIGISQGGLIARSFVEQCTGFPNKIRNFLTIGSPHMGIADIPRQRCEHDMGGGASSLICKVPQSMLDNLAFSDKIQNSVAAAGYYRNTENLAIYKEKSSFLSKLNNEKVTDQLSSQKERLSAVNGFMMVMFEKDDVVLPPASELFGEWSKKDDAGNRVIIKMEDTDLYKNDYIGLKTLDEKKKLFQVHINKNHIEFTDEDIINHFVPFLKS